VLGISRNNNNFVFVQREEDPAMNLELKIELIRRFGSQIVAAKRLGIRESKLSHIVRGHEAPSEKERETLERTFGLRLTNKLLKRSTEPAEQPSEGAEGT
jgi:ribosome-binding protein aMBF1 (putative translation factor)